jgi:uncharacterized protein YjbI with pentapeptide repeats
MTTPPTNAVSAVLLVDQRIQGYESIVSAVKPDVRCIVFDVNQVDETCKQQSITSFQYMTNKIAELGVSSFSSIGVVQHNFNTPYHHFFGVNPSELVTIASIESVDPTLQTWVGMTGFISGLKTTYNIQNLDLMACALYSNPDWKYIIDTLTTQTQVTIRASTDDTGATEMGGNWFLESHTGVNLKSVYFTDSIDSFSGLLDMGMGVFLSSGGGWMNMITPPSTLAVWGNSLTTTVLPTSLSSQLVNITKVFSYGVFSTHSYIFALDTNGVLYGFGTKAFGGASSNIVNVQSNSGWIDYFAQNGLIGLLKSDGTVGFLTDQNDGSAFIYYSTFTVSNAIAVYNMSVSNADPNRRFGVLDSSSTLRVYTGARSISTTAASLAYTITNVAKAITGDGSARQYIALTRDRTVADALNEITWTNVANLYVNAGAYAGAHVFGIDTSNNLLYTGYMNGYNYDGTGMTNAPVAARTNVVTVKLSNIGTTGVGLLLQSNGNVTGWTTANFDFGNPSDKKYIFTSQNYQAVSLYISRGLHSVTTVVQCALRHDGTLYIRGNYGTNTYSNVIDVVTGYMFIAFLLNNGNVILHTSSNTFVTVVSTNNAVGLYIFGENELNVILTDGSLVRYYNGSITYDTSVVTYNGSTTQSNTILNSNVKGVVATIGLQTAAIQTSSSLSSFNKFDLFQYFQSRNNRRINNFNSLNGTYTIDDYRTITLIAPFLPTTNTYTLLIPDFQSSANLVSSPYNIKSNITIGASVQHFIAAIEEGEQFTINGDTSATYVIHSPYVYSVTTSPTFALTRVSTITAATNVYTVYGDSGFSGVAVPAPTLSNFGPFTIANDRAFTMPTPTSNLATIYGNTWSQVGGNLVGIAGVTQLGASVRISEDGTTVIVGAPQDNNPTKGYVGVYRNISGTWTLLGSLLYGDSQSNHFGDSVGISADGSIIAVGASQHNGFFAVGSGYVKVFKFINDAWVQQGANITGGGFDFRNGFSISLSADGKIVATGEMLYNVVGTLGGRVRVFVYDETNTATAPIGWTQLGGDILGPVGSLFGRNVSISSDGYTVAISGPEYNTTSLVTGGGTSGGLVRVFRYSSSKVTNITDVSNTNFGPIGWNRLGGDFYGLSGARAGGENGLNLSSDGTIVAFGYVTYSNRGIARVFKYSASKSTNIVNENDTNYGPIGWYRLGQDIARAVSGDVFGSATSLSTDGTVLSVGGLYIDSNSPTNNNDLGGVVSYSYSSSSNTWSSIGQTLYGLNAYSLFGRALSSSGNGTVIAIGAPSGNLNGNSSGYVQIYRIDVSGGFTYSSSNTSVVDVYSSVAIPRGNGTAVITAEQSGYGEYINKSITANLTVQAASPTYTYTVAKPQSITKTFGVDTSFSLTDLLTGVSSSNGAYTFSSTSAEISIAGNVATILAYTPSSIAIVASQDASGSYSAGTTTISLLVNRGTPTYQSVSQITKTYLTDVSFSLAAVMSGVSNSSGAYTFTSASSAISISGAVVTILGSSGSTISILASQDASGNYNASSTTISLVVNPATPTFQSVAQIQKTFLTDVSFSLAPIVAGMSNSNGSYIFTVASNATGYITISGNVVTILAYTPTAVDIDVYQEASGNFTWKTGTLSLLVARKVPSYGSFTPGTKIFGDASFSIVPPTTDNSGAAITYTSSAPSVATISSDGTVVTIVGHGSTTITASQVAGGNFAAGSVTGVLTVNRVAPTFLKSFTIPDKTFGDAPFSLLPFTEGLDNTDGAYSFSSSNPSIVSISSVDNVTATILAYTPTTPVTITVDIDACGNYAAARTSGTLTVNRANPTYQSVSQVSKTFGVDASFSLSAVMAGISNSSGAYTFSSSSAAVTVNGDVATIAAYTESAITITASQVASGNYNGGSTTFSVLVARGAPTYQSVSQVSKTFGVDVSFSLSAVMAGISNSSGAYTFSSSSAAVTVNGDVATIAAYTESAITITATQGASGNYNASSTTFSVLVARGAPTYQSVSQVSKTFGVDASFSLSAVMAGISNSSGAYTFSSSSAAVTVNGDVATIAAYTESAITITATQDASGNYSASSTTFSVLVARGAPTYQSVSQVSKTFGVDASFSLSAVMAGISNSSGAYTFSSSSAAVTVNGDVATIAAYTESAITITASQDASGNYNASSTTFTVLVARGTPTYQSISQVSKTFGADISFSLTQIMDGVSNSDGAYSFSSSSPAEISINGNVATILAYTESAVTITASQDASGNYNASSKTFNVLVVRATPTYQSVSQITKTFGTDVSFSLLAEPGVAGMSNSDGAYSLFSTTSDAVSIVGDVVTILAYTPSAITITASQDASGNYASSSNTISLLINPGAPTYTPISQITKTFGTDVSFSLSPLVANLSNSSGAFTFSSTSDAISIAGNVVSILAYTPSAIYITATQEAFGNYTSGSTNDSISLLVNRKVPAYGAFTLPAVTFEDAPYSLVALNLAPTSESNATYSYTSSDTAVATVNSDGTVVTVIGQGTTTITVSQDASGNYAAGSTSTSLLVNRAAPTFLKGFTIPDKTFGDASFSLLPFTVGLDNTDGAYSFASSNPSVVSIDGEYATILAYSPTPITIYVTIDACGNYAASSTDGTLTINRAAPTYQSVSTVTKTFGDAPFSLSDTMSGVSNSSGSYTFTSSNTSVVSIDADGVTASILAYSASTITITASQVASGNYTSGTTTFSLTVARGAPTIGALSLGPLNGYYDVSDGYFTLTAPTSNSLGTFTYTSDNNSVAVISSPIYSTTNLSARYDPSDSANYTVGTGGAITRLSNLTGTNARHLVSIGNPATIVTVDSKNMVSFLNSGSGFSTSFDVPSNHTIFMVVRHNPQSTSIPDESIYGSHGGQYGWIIGKKPGSSNTVQFATASNLDPVEIGLNSNTSYILISRVGAPGRPREFWAYPASGSSTYEYKTTSAALSNYDSVFRIGSTGSQFTCQSYIGEIMYYNAAIADSDLSNNLMYLQQKWFNIASATKTVRFIANGSANITATQDICGNYATGSVSSLLRVGATAPTFGTFTVSSSAKTFGDGPFTLTPPTSNSNGAFTFSSNNASVITISGTTATIVGGGLVTITASQDPSGSFTRKSVTANFTVQTKNPNLRNFASIVRSFADGSFTVTAPETDSSGSITYSSSNTSIVTTPTGSAAFTIVAGGEVTITATQAATANYSSSSLTTTVTITPVAPTASYSNFNRPYNLGTFTIPAPTTNSTGAITYVSSDTSVATIEGTTVVIKKVGETTITATIAATATYLTRDISAVFTVVRGTPTMSGLSNQTVLRTQTPYTLSPMSNSTGTFSYVSDNSSVVFITNGTTFNVASVSVVPATITATISEDASGNFNARSITFTITVIRATSNLSTHGVFVVPSTMTYGDTPVNSITLPTSNSSGAITYSSVNSNIASIHPTTGVITAVGTGFIYFIATQAQTDVYNANSVISNYIQVFTKSVTQTRAEPYTSSTITKYYGDPYFTLETVSESNATKFFYPSISGVVNVNTVGNSARIDIINVGEVVITAQQASNSQYNTSNTLTWTITVEKGSTALTGLASTLTKNVTNAPFTLSASSASSAAVSYALSNPDSSNVLTIHPISGLVTLKRAGSATVVASQGSSSLYNAPSSVSCVITVTEAGSALQGSTITNSIIYDSVDMSGASLSGTTVTGTSLVGASLVNAVMTGATVTNSSMNSVNMTGATMASAVITGTDMANASLVNATMTGATFQNSTMSSVNMAGASMANTTISSSNLAGATMTSVVMTGATVRNSTMSSVNMAGASMANTDISGTNLTGATMTSVIMTGATVRNSTMSSVNLTNASLAAATITGTTFASSTMTNAVLTGATLTDSTLTSTVLTGASLAGANVSGSSFVGATLDGADLSGATVTNANFTNANISGANITNVAFSQLQKVQLLKNSNNRAIGGIQVSDVSGSTILSVISEASPAVSIPNIANAVIKVVIPPTSTNPATVIQNVVLDTSSSDKFYFPINEGEYFQIAGVKYYTSNGVVKNYATDEVVEVISYGSKSIWLIAGSVIANVLDTNTISQSTFTVPAKKLDTDAPFNITVAPTSNSNAPIVYSSNHTSVATIHPSTGLITIVGQGYVRFTATQAATLLYEGGSKTSNEMFVNKLINFTLSGLNQTILMSTSGLLDASAVSLETTDATAVFYVKVSDMTNIFKIQTDSHDMNDTDASDVKYYVFHRKWPTELKINPAHAMMNKTESNGMLGTTDIFTASKMLAKHDFLRYLALRLFNTIHGVDLFSNESDLLENTTYWGEDVNANIHSTMGNISTTSSDESMSYDASGNKYLTNATSGNTNLCRELVRQLTANAPSRFGSIVDANTPQSIPLMEDDSINFKVTFQSAPSQNVLTGVTEIPSRSYMVKLVLKNSVSGLNTVVTDSEMYPNSYPYSSSVTTYAPTSASSAVYNVFSPPAPIPFARFGFNGWYYTNSSAWVTSASRNHVKWLLPASSGASSTVGSLRYIRANLKIHNKTSTPFIVVYTQGGSWRKYPVVNNSALVNGTAYSFYVNFNSYTTEPAVIGFTNEALTGTVGAGSFASNELILNIALETDSSAATGAVDFTLASMIVGEETNEKEYGFEADVPASYA